MLVEVFKAGSHIDSNGTLRSFSTEDIDKIIQNYSAQYANNEKAPAVIGHPQTNNPAYGWVKSLQRKDDILLAEFEDIDEAFKEAVNKKKFPKTSVALYPDLKLRHVGFLGAVPPAVKGLKDVTFNADDKVSIFEYAEAQPATQGTQAGGTGLTVSLEMLTSILRSELNDEVAGKIKKIIEEKMGAKFSSPSIPEEVQKRLQALEQKNQELMFNAYFDDAVRAGKLIPAQRESFKAIWDLQPANMEFAEQSQNAIRAFVNTLPDTHLFRSYEKAEVGNTNEIAEAVKNMFKK